jgi:hypothetical protein
MSQNLDLTHYYTRAQIRQLLDQISSNPGTGTGTGEHSEPLTDGNANFIFAATLTTGGDIIVVTGIPN